MSIPIVIILTILALSQSAYAESRWTKIARWSAAAVVASSAADAVTSWGRPEAHPGLRSAGGQFGSRGLAIKAGVTAGYLAATRLILHRRPGVARQVAIVDFAVAGVFGAAAAYNHRLGAPRVRGPQPIIITPGRTVITWTPCPDPTCGGVLP